MASNWITFEVKVDVHVFAESTGVIIPVCLGIAESLQNNIGLDENIFHSEMTP